MKPVRAAGSVPAAPFHMPLQISRAGLFACVGVLAALNAQASQLIGELSYEQPLVALSALGGISAVIWFAMYAALKIGFEDETSRLSRLDLVIITTAIVFSLLPVAALAKAALELCGLYLLIGSGSEDQARRVGIILVGLTGPLIWGRFILYTFGGPLLSLDAHLVGAVIRTPVEGNIVHFANSSREFLIGIPCSSVHNISIAVVLWATAAALFRLRFDLLYVLCGLAMMTFMFALNIVRLSAIGLCPSSFEFLHSGTGSQLFGWGGLIGAACLEFLGVSCAVKRQQ